MKIENTLEDGKTFYIVRFSMVLGLKKNKLGALFLNVGRSIVVYLCPLQAGARVFVRVTISLDNAIRVFSLSLSHVVMDNQTKLLQERTKSIMQLFAERGSLAVILNVFNRPPQIKPVC